MVNTIIFSNEFHERGWDVGIVSIGSNRTQQYSDDNIKEWLEQKDDSDIVLFMDWGRFDSPLLDKEKLPSAFWVQESGDDPQNFERNFPNQKRFHMTLSPDAESTETYKVKVSMHIGGLILQILKFNFQWKILNHLM